MIGDLTTTLAADFETVVTVAIGIIIFAGSAIANAISKQREKRKAQTGADSDGLRVVDEDDSVEAIAKRRREQLLRQRGGSGAASGEPSNMTMAERIARARAKARYEQRSGGQSSSGQQPHRPQADISTQREQADRQRQQATERQRREQAQALEQAQQQARAQAQRQRQLQAQRARQAQQQRQQQLAARKVASGSSHLPSHQQPSRRDDADQQQQRRRKKRRKQRSSEQTDHALGQEIGTTDELKVVASARSKLGLTNRKSLRKAILLKEILDHPIGIRRNPDPWQPV